MATVNLVDYDTASPAVRQVYDDIMRGERMPLLHQQPHGCRQEEGLNR
jgi:hypothetical protein